MSKGRVAMLALVVAALGAPGEARAWGAPGCSNLPEYNRALGALQGMTSACDMSVEEARRVIAARDGTAVAPVRTAPERVERPRASRPARHHNRRLHHR